MNKEYITDLILQPYIIFMGAVANSAKLKNDRGENIDKEEELYLLIAKQGFYQAMNMDDKIIHSLPKLAEILTLETPNQILETLKENND